MGTAKAWLRFGDEFLLQRVVRVVNEATKQVVVVAAEGQELPPLPTNVSIVRDLRPARGPLEGIYAGLKSLFGQADAALVTACDVPFISAAFVRRMIELLEDYPIAAPSVDGHWYPLSAVYRLETLGRIEEALAADRLRVRDLLDQCNARVVTPEDLAEADPELEALRACNTPEEFEAALARYRAQR